MTLRCEKPKIIRTDPAKIDVEFLATRAPGNMFTEIPLFCVRQFADRHKGAKLLKVLVTGLRSQRRSREFVRITTHGQIRRGT